MERLDRRRDDAAGAMRFGRGGGQGRGNSPGGGGGGYWAGVKSGEDR